MSVLLLINVKKILQLECEKDLRRAGNNDILSSDNAENKRKDFIKGEVNVWKVSDRIFSFYGTFD